MPRARSTGTASATLASTTTPSSFSSRSDVDGLYEVLKQHKINVVDPPADYPNYGEGYYAVFFTDPDGLKLEGMVFKPPRKKKGRKGV